MTRKSYYIDKTTSLITFWGLGTGKTKFRAHRLGGISWILCYVFTWYKFLSDYPFFLSWNLPILVALIGTFQGVSATLTFWFLPNQQDNGFFSDRGILSRLFVIENVFYQLLVLFGATYPLHRAYLSSTMLGNVLIHLFIFFPYVLLRPLFPTTRFSYTNNGSKVSKYRSSMNASFYETSTQMIKIFYLWGKHIMGMGFQYLLYLGVITPADMRSWGWPLFLLNAGTVSFSVFLHTLRFKKLIDPRYAHGIYVFMAYLSFLSLKPLLFKLLEAPVVLLIVVVGIQVNMLRSKVLMNLHFTMAAYFIIKMRFDAVEDAILSDGGRLMGNWSGGD
ncbi:hypothetical protein TrST_g10523 [Triparma strigata]|uniref:Uncharacterized protein n=1 Tax=Triparma strigata TaxID=1606541 RepID=A0A9W6ZLQ9_9STRA|nr:hypothetical protein TrST_g10523 [Triparma strigata]